MKELLAIDAQLDLFGTMRVTIEWGNARGPNSIAVVHGVPVGALDRCVELVLKGAEQADLEVVFGP